MPLVLHGVGPDHSPAVLEAQDLLQGQIRSQGAECSIRTPGRNSKTPVESGQELLQHGLDLFNSGCSSEPEFRDQPVLEGSGCPLDSPLCLRRQVEYHFNPQLCHCPSKLGGRPGGADIPNGA